MTLLTGSKAFAQVDNIKVHNKNNFYFHYFITGLGSNSHRFQPALTVYKNKFTYIKEQNSYWSKRTKKRFISKGTLRQSSVNSILTIVSGLKDSTIYKTNPCIMSGQIIDLIIAYGMDTTKFTLHNTFDSTALKIIEILNPYLPKNQKLCCSAQMIKEEEYCWIKSRNKLKELSKDSTGIKK